MRRFMAAGGYWRDESALVGGAVFGAALRRSSARPQRQPFALVVDTYEPHEPWTPPRAYIDLYGDPALQRPASPARAATCA